MLGQKVNAIVVLLNITKMPFKRTVQIGKSITYSLGKALGKWALLHCLWLSKFDKQEIVSQCSFLQARSNTV